MPEYRSNTDEELILMFQNDDVEAFNEIVFRYKNKVVNFLYRYTGNREEAEDLAQDTFIKVFRSKHLYKEIAKFSTWFYTIAVNTAKTNAMKKIILIFINLFILLSCTEKLKKKDSSLLRLAKIL